MSMGDLGMGDPPDDEDYVGWRPRRDPPPLIGAGEFAPGWLEELSDEQRNTLACIRDLARMDKQLREGMDEIAVTAREQSLSFAQIGWAMGLTAQAAQQRAKRRARGGK